MPSVRSQIEKANRIAAEIENQVSDNVHIREERGQVVDDSGMDEEDRFSGVVRKVATGTSHRSATLVGVVYDWHNADRCGV